MIEDKVIELIKEYLTDVEIFMSKFYEKFQRRDVLRAWREKIIPQNGRISNEIEYELHGIGCRIYFHDRIVDFDFGPSQRIDGFDVWRLEKYLQSRNDSSLSMTRDELQDGFNKLISMNIIEKKFLDQNCHLYFFK
jgi:hypothetical protein